MLVVMSVVDVVVPGIVTGTIVVVARLVDAVVAICAIELAEASSICEPLHLAQATGEMHSLAAHGGWGAIRFKSQLQPVTNTYRLQ